VRPPRSADLREHQEHEIQYVCASLFQNRLIYLHVVRAVINEVLRLYPPVPLNVRESRAEACTLPPSDGSYANDDPRPFYMPGGTTIMYLPLLMQRNPALWGPDADVFDPERWLHPDRVSKFVANPTMYAPFSAGPRIVSVPSVHLFLARVLKPDAPVPGPELRVQRGFILPRATVTGIRHVHVGARVPARGLATAARVEISQGSPGD
jgi:hypothetical protein